MIPVLKSKVQIFVQECQMKQMSEGFLRLASAIEGDEGGFGFISKIALSKMIHLQQKRFGTEVLPWVRILYYHGVEPFEIEIFRNQLIYMLEHYDIITLQRALQLWIDPSAAGTGRYLALTFDDGYLNNLTCAAPVLEELGLPATFFISTGFVEAKEEGDNNALEQFSRRLDTFSSPLNWEGVKALSDKGFELGAHAITHRNMAKLTAHEVEKEVRKSKDRLERKTGAKIRYFAYPYGVPKSFNEDVKKVLSDTGIEAAFTTMRGNVLCAKDIFEIPRSCIRVAWPSDIIDMYLKGRLEKTLDKIFRLRMRIKPNKYLKP